MKCVRLTLIKGKKTGISTEVIQEMARSFQVEGLVQLGEAGVRVVACGNHESIDNFVDMLHKEANKKSVAIEEFEPFLKDKDYRGVFRIIE